MLSLITILSILYTIKSILFEKFYNNYIIFLYYPIELAFISIFYTNLNYLKWTFVGLFDYTYISWFILVPWIISFFLYNIYYLIKERKNINRWSYYIYIIKYCISNYIFILLLSTNIILNYYNKDDNNENFIIILIAFLLFNIMAFCFPGIIFKFIYGDKLYFYREKFSLLINNFKPKYKYYIIILLYLKFINISFLFIYIINNNLSKYILLFNLLLFNIIIYKNNIFLININKYIYIQSLLSLFTILISITENYYNNDIYLLTMYCLSSILNIIYFIYSNVIIKKLSIVNQQNEEIQLNLF
jgi:hypothetical protein